MILANIFALLALVLSFVYMIMGLIAYGNRVEKTKNGPDWTLSPFWALFPLAYNDFGQKLCSKGKVVFYLMLFSTVFWLFIKNA